jgi:hypothetical protein
VSASAVVNKDPRCVHKRQSEPRYAFVDLILVRAVLYIINFANFYQNGFKKARKKAKEGRLGKGSFERSGTHFGYFHYFLWKK